jgi:hypothetical protein
MKFKGYLTSKLIIGSLRRIIHFMLHSLGIEGLLNWSKATANEESRTQMYDFNIFLAWCIVAEFVCLAGIILQ